MSEEETGLWRRVFGLKQQQRRFEPPGRPGHSMTGRVVTGEDPDWSRYDGCMRISAVLVLEPDNPHDKFAVRVTVDGEHVGYLSRGTAKRLGKRLRALAAEENEARCMAYIGRAAGGDNPNLGVSLRLPYNGEILQGKT